MCCSRYARFALAVVFAFAPVCLIACTKKKTDGAVVAEEAGAMEAGAPAAAARAVEVLPVGHWESHDIPGSKLCLTLMPQGFYRITATVPHYRNDARVSGRVIEARALSKTNPRSFEITLNVRNIVAKEIGRCRKSWVDYQLPAAEVLGVRMTPTEGTSIAGVRNDPWTPPLEDGDATARTEPPKRFTIQFDESFETVEMCAPADQARDAEAPRCRKLTKATSRTTRMVGSYSYGCKTDRDCVTTFEGELCAPCKCVNAAIYRGDRDSSQDKQARDWFEGSHEIERECALPTARPPECPKCADPVIRCLDHRCKVVERDGGTE